MIPPRLSRLLLCLVGEVTLNPVDVQELLDRSCAVALNNWSNPHRKPGQSWSEDLACNAYYELNRELSAYRMPNYDDRYVTAAYIVRYQISHIFMAKLSLERLNQRRESHQRTIRIIDFGSGASACRIATTLMVAESLERGQSIESVEVLELDSSSSMQAMGETVWKALVEIVLTEFANYSLAQAIRIVSSCQSHHWTPPAGGRPYDWLTAFHAIYPDAYDMRTEVAQVFFHARPAMGVFTCHSGKLEHLKAAFPFANILEEYDGGKESFFPGYIPGGNIQCQTNFLARQATVLGFGQQVPRPYLRASGPAVLWGSQNTEQ